MAQRRLRSSAVNLTVTAMLAAGLSGCAEEEPDPEHAAICVDSNTQQRVEDEDCGGDFTDEQHLAGSNNNGGGGSAATSVFLWYFIARSFAVPPLGGSITGVRGGSFNRPSNLGGVYRGVSSRGGTVTKGGFGTSLKGSSGG